MLIRALIVTGLIALFAVNPAAWGWIVGLSIAGGIVWSVYVRARRGYWP